MAADSEDLVFRFMFTSLENSPEVELRFKVSTYVRDMKTTILTSNWPPGAVQASEVERLRLLAEGKEFIDTNTLADLKLRGNNGSPIPVHVNIVLKSKGAKTGGGGACEGSAAQRAVCYCCVL
mmetsp:Transcript_5223/g.12406  ORF Transcript_5223/g.12406 Transcript_5223/m.12406 type:complete len:123 (+) Transcript_5223:96-464(+)